MENIEQLQELVARQEKQLKGLWDEKEILRQQGKDARKKVRELERRLQKIEASKWYKLGELIKKVLRDGAKLVKAPFVFVKKLFAGTSKEQNKVEEVAVVVQPAELQACAAADMAIENRELTYPDADMDKVKSIFSKIEGKLTNVSVVVCIHNAIYDVEECLLSLWNNRTFPYEIILVDDGSDEQTKVYVEKCAEIMGAKLIRNETAQGYTISANKGLRASDSDYIILLNSDTIVTSGWVEKMLNCFQKNEQVGIVSPLSNAASWQSVPEIHDAVTGDWKINTLEDNVSVEMMAQIVERASKHRYPQVPVLNGFCFMISRKLIDVIGYLDEETFPRGYGEEVDYCMRATKADFSLRVVDDTYIFHEKSKSFTHKVRKELGKESKEKLKKKHGEEVYLSLDKQMKACTDLGVIREEVKQYYSRITELPILGKKIAFLLTARGGSGGANSVCQEVMGMRKLGVQAFVINSSNYKDEFEKNYPELVPYVRYFNKKSEKSLLDTASEFDLIIGTIFTTVKGLKLISEKYSDKKFGYYIQDYEPLFFSEIEDYWKEAKASYTLLDDICMFAKTRWIADTVEKEHGRKVNIVEPSIDTGLYNPYVIEEKETNFPLQITAMIRPKTERRNPIGTMHVLQMLKEKYGSQIKVCLFGCEDAEIKSLGDVAGFEYVNYGVLKRWEVAELLANSHVFLDMSTYQAFGRTGLESMCVGCVAVMPEEGGVYKYAVDNENAIITDTLDDELVYNRMCELIEKPEMLKKLQKNGLETAKEYNIMQASVSELLVLSEHCFGRNSAV